MRDQVHILWKQAGLPYVHLPWDRMDAGAQLRWELLAKVKAAPGRKAKNAKRH